MSSQNCGGLRAKRAVSTVTKHGTFGFLVFRLQRMCYAGKIMNYAASGIPHIFARMLV